MAIHINGIEQTGILGVMKKLTGTTGATEGNLTSIAHGLTISKVIGYHVLVTQASGNKIPPEYTSVAGYEFSAFLDSTNVKVQLHATNSENLLSKAISVLINHEE